MWCCLSIDGGDIRCAGLLPSDSIVGRQYGAGKELVAVRGEVDVCNLMRESGLWVSDRIAGRQYGEQEEQRPHSVVIGRRAGRWDLMHGGWCDIRVAARRTLERPVALSGVL